MKSNFDPETYKVLLPYPNKDLIKKQILEQESQKNLSLPEGYVLSAEHLAGLVKIEYDKLMKAYNEADSAARNQFELDCEEEFGFSKLSPKIKSALHAKAWSDGHSYGYSEVKNQYYDLVELVETVISIYEK